MGGRQIGPYAIQLHQRIAQHVAQGSNAKPFIILWIVWQITLSHIGKDNAADTIISLHCC